MSDLQQSTQGANPVHLFDTLTVGRLPQVAAHAGYDGAENGDALKCSGHDESEEKTSQHEGRTIREAFVRFLPL